MTDHQGHNGHYSQRPTHPVSGVSQRGRLRGGRSAPTGMMRIVDSMMSPFVQCFQPPLDPCADMNIAACGSGYSACGSGPARPPSSNSATRAQVPRAMVTPAASRRPIPGLQQSPSYDYSHVSQPPTRTVTDIECPLEADVLCGRGGSSNRHNVHFRELVAANKATYTTLTKKQKMLFSRQIVDVIHGAGGRFLSKDQSTGKWCDIGMQRSLEKASQALREKATNNNPNTSVTVSDEGVEATAAIEHRNAKPNPRTVEAPSLVLPHQIRHIYRPKPAVVTPTYQQQQEHWVANFPTPPHRHHQPNSYHPSDRLPNMPAPHMGAFPFTSRQMSRHGRQAHRTRSVPSNTPHMVSPMAGVPHPLSWQQASYYNEVYASSSFERQPSTEYPSSVASCNTSSSAVTQSAPEFHQYYQDFEPPRNSTTSHPHPNPELTPKEVKRQCTREEETREQAALEEEEVILVDSDHQTTLNNSLQEGSEQLPSEVESKLCLHEKVICSPAEVTQRRSARRHYYHHNQNDVSPSSSRKETHNTSAEAADMAGLAALSSAAYLLEREWTN